MRSYEWRNEEGFYQTNGRSEKSVSAQSHCGEVHVNVQENEREFGLRVRKCECEQALSSGEEQCYRITHRTIIDVVNADGTAMTIRGSVY